MKGNGIRRALLVSTRDLIIEKFEIKSQIWLKLYNLRNQ
jgi:hypothetical protein